MDLVPDLAVGLAFGEQRQDALLLGAEAGQLLVLEQALALHQAVQHSLGQGGVEQALAAANGEDGADQVVAADA